MMFRLFFISVIFLSFFLTGCSEKEEDNSSASTSSSSATASGCRGRLNGIKDGPTTLYLPYSNSESYKVSQTWYGTYSHYMTGGEHALDFPMNNNDTIVPVAAGRVIAVKEDSNTNCSSSCSDANYVIVDHGDGFIGRYYHFCQNCVDVSPGDVVSSSTRLGGAGNTGWSTETHLHFELADWEEGCTVKYGFANINSGAREALSVDQSYTSQNPGSSTYTASTITGETYNNVGVTLTSSITWYLSSGDTITVSGSLTSAAVSEGANGIAVFIVDESNQLVSDSLKKYTTSSTFSETYTIPSLESGKTYSLGISKSINGSYHWDNPPNIVIH